MSKTCLKKKPSIGVLLKRCSENMHQIYWKKTAISIKLQRNVIEITLWHGCSPANLLHIFRAPFPKNTSGGLLMCLGPYQAYVNI